MYKPQKIDKTLVPGYHSQEFFVLENVVIFHKKLTA